MTITAGPNAARIDRSRCGAPSHGTRHALHLGCICLDSYDDEAAYMREWRRGERRLVPAIGTKRRIWAMWAQGHDCPAIAEVSGLTEVQIRHIINRKRDTVRRVFADAIAAAYILLADTEGPNYRLRSRMRNAGHYPPSMWVDIDEPDEDLALMPPPAVDHVELVVDEVFMELLLAGKRNPAEVLPRHGMARTTYAVIYLMRPGNTPTSLTRELGCNIRVANTYQAWADAVRPTLAAKGITRGWRQNIPEIAAAVAAERDRLRWQRIRFTTATVLAVTSGAMHGLALTTAVKVCGLWRAWPYRLTPDVLEDVVEQGELAA